MSVRVILNKNVNLENCTFISGFHGIGLTGFIAVKHLVNSLNADRIGFIESSKLPPFVSVSEGFLQTPFELYKYLDNVFLLIEVSPFSDEHSNFSKTIVDWIIDEGFSKAILIGGLDKRFKRNDEKMRFICTSSFKQKYGLDEKLLLDKGLYVFGLLALFLARFEIRKFPAIAVLPYAEPSRPDPKAAADAVKYINKTCGLNVNVSKLIKDAEIIESEVELLMKQWSEKVKSDKNKTLYM
ncbi:MAG: hypothetical protein DRJ30_05155 [Candidatus Methanomethylicota archaeon]|nr:MAG: hypothetical protein DRJ30_05155 [Candidatus Verstraetearchaeota archaeon]